MEDIFKNWKESELHKNRLFITDGIIKHDDWEKSESKILFLLKEAYDSKPQKETWDLSKHIQRKKVSGRTLKPMAQWAYGINHVMSNNEIITYKSDGEEVKHALLSSAVINLKKSQGKSKSNNDNLKVYVEADWHLIKEQMKSISPKIVICGNTWSLIKGKISYQEISDRAYLSEGILFIDYWHPANRAANKMNYYALCALVQLAMKALSLRNIEEQTP
ncbi:hypothetical protein [uncultured Psychrobacter sp.]|uniref:hypothetical protein n=1 Tax=uncultured Psychrobacter sp. TaxID=259303 RepID=UPI0034574665